MSQTVAAFMLDRLRQWGVTRIYGYPGDGINGLLGAFHEFEDDIDFVQTRHEEIAAFAACAHGKLTGEVGVCMATSGPGAIHLLNGLYDAKLDHAPWWRSSASRPAWRWDPTSSRRSTSPACSRTWPASSCRCASPPSRPRT